MADKPYNADKRRQGARGAERRKTPIKRTTEYLKQKQNIYGSPRS